MRDDFAIFIMVWGRPEKVTTYKTLRRLGYTGKVYFVADDLDLTLEEYRKRYGDRLLVFSKLEVKDEFDAGDNTGDLRSTLYAVNVIPRLARQVGVKYFGIFCDDYTGFYYKVETIGPFRERPVRNLDRAFERLLEYYESIPALTIAMSQGGDWIGGKWSRFDERSRRKAMNTFICSVDRPFQFVGRLNEDVTTYVLLGNRGYLFFTYPYLRMAQPPTQSRSGGLTDVYLDYGTYVKSFYTVMYAPSCSRIGVLKQKYGRIHHKINWDAAVPCILREEWRKIDRHVGGVYGQG